VGIDASRPMEEIDMKWNSRVLRSYNHKLEYALLVALLSAITLWLAV
jgi:hypothetical protein